MPETTEAAAAAPENAVPATEPTAAPEPADLPEQAAPAREPAKIRCDGLDFARQVTAEAICAPDHYLDVLTLAYAVTHRIDDFYSAPVILALGKKGSGKSTCLTAANYLAANTTSVTGITALTAPSYVASYRANNRWTPTLDEANHLFGEAGEGAKSSRLRTYINQGYNRGTAWAEHQEKLVPVRIPIFGVVFLAGQGQACPDDMHDRAIVLLMESAPDGTVTADFADERVRNMFTFAGTALESWAKSLPKPDIAAVREASLHPRLVKRNMEVWGPLFAMAMAAGDVWVKRCLIAFERIECDAAATPVYTPEVQLLLDYREFSEAQAQAPAPAPALTGLSGMFTGTESTEPAVEGVASGEFAAFAMEASHGAFAWMKPGQFRQFAVAQLGPTSPFYDAAKKTMVRGWSDMVHRINMSRAQQEIERLAAEKPDTENAPAEWLDF